MEVKGRSVCVGLSGGVDSAVSAALLQKAGANVTGVFIKGWYPPGMPCTWAEDRRDAMRVAAHLRIPFSTLDASAEYKKSVIDYLIAEYSAGRTPNPDVMCNREVKFGAFFDFAKKHGAESIATGHYAQSKDGVLLRGHDAAKDQSYFLWAVPKKVLREVIFPIGEYSKTKVRSLARTFTLPVSEKKDSQGICFLGDVSIEDFLKAECGHEPGRALDESGLEIGSHEGAVLYTLGERVHLESAPSGPWYVHAKNIKTNEITVGKERSILRTSDEGVSVTHPNAFQELSNATEAQSRYHGELISGRFDSVSNIFVLEAPTLEPLTSGQSLVLYKGKECVGGGIISS